MYSKPIIIFSIIFIVLFVIITIIRIVLSIFFRYLIKKYKKLLSSIKSNFSGKKPTSNIEGERLRDQEKEKKLGQVIKINREKDILQDFIEKQNQTKIIGVVKPIGKWTSLILGQKVVGLMQQVDKLKQQNDAGYWANMAHSQRRSGPKSQGRF